MKTLSVKLPAPLANWLSRKARKLGRSQSDLVRDALEEQRKGESKSPSCRDLLADLGGAFDGPSDLSTNPKRMEGFGE